MKKLSLFTLLLLTACFATASPVYLPDGSSGFRIVCDNPMSGTPECLQKASDICGSRGYQTYDQNGHLKSDNDQTLGAITAFNSNPPKGSKTTDAQKNMFIKCRAAPPPIQLQKQ